MEIITKTENISQINISYGNFIPISINSSSDGQLNVYIDKKLVNIYDFENDPQAITKSILDYLAGMTDTFLIKSFNELLSF